MEKVCIIGSGNWGTVIAKIVGENASRFPTVFENEVNLWVYEEIVSGKKLSELINTTHENAKYMPGMKLPENVLAIPELKEAVAGCTLLFFVVPEQFLRNVCATLKGSLVSNCRGISLIKSFEADEDRPNLLSDIISDILNIDISVLMGGNIAVEIANEMFAEATIGCRDRENGLMFQKLLNRPYFRVDIVDEVASVELCGSLKNIVALAAGIIDGLGYGVNTKAAVIRLGLLEMRKFINLFFPSKDNVYFENCGVADLIVSCFEGRNRKCAEQVVRTKKSFQVVEEELLKGQKLQGTITVQQVDKILKNRRISEEFPIFSTVYSIAFEQMDPKELLKRAQTVAKY